ncbi:DNA polymerase, partial [Streptomyces katsurahamanus]
MQTYKHKVAGDVVTVRVPETTADLNAFRDWASTANRRGPIALDTETTGLDIYSDRFRLRTVQFGDARDAWVIHWERGGYFRTCARLVLDYAETLLIHNASYDWLVLDQCGAITLEELAPRTRDTQIMAKLLDPRQVAEGGIGSGLKPLSGHYIDPTAPDTQGDLTAVFRSLGLTKATGWAGIDIRHPTYNLYAGLDVALTSRLYPILSAELDRFDVRPMLTDYEHEIARICATMQRTGLLVDGAYTQELHTRLTEEAAFFVAKAARYGVENVNSTAQIAEALTAMGETLTERTDSGKVKVDKAVLMRLADLDQNSWEPLSTRTPNPLADAVLRGKRAGKWRTTYAERFATAVDPAGRIHPTVNTLQARTGRMSVSGDLAAQTLPSSDWMIRRAILAEEGHVMMSCDFEAVEMRVLAALADVKRMKVAISAGQDLHDYTASLVYGPGFTKAHRKICKGIGFGKVYGGGAATVSRQTGAPHSEVVSAMATYDRVYPEIKRFGNRHQRIARDNRMVTVTLTGRRLPLDRDRAYAVTNYQVQSAARDVLGQSLINMSEAGLLPYLRLP